MRRGLGAFQHTVCVWILWPQNHPASVFELEWVIPLFSKLPLIQATGLGFDDFVIYFFWVENALSCKNGLLETNIKLKWNKSVLSCASESLFAFASCPQNNWEFHFLLYVCLISVAGTKVFWHTVMTILFPVLHNLLVDPTVSKKESFGPCRNVS